MKLSGSVVHDRDERDSFYHAECFREVTPPFDFLHSWYACSFKPLFDAGV